LSTVCLDKGSQRENTGGRNAHEEDTPVSLAGSVTRWIAQLKRADQTAAQRLWEKYFGQLVARARHKLAGAPRRAADEADVVQSAFASFFQAAQNGRRGG
jgi:hypothetical protein